MSKKILTLLLLLVALSLFAVLIENPFKDPTPSQAVFFPGVTQEDVVGVDVERFVQGFHFSKKDQGQWSVSAAKTALQEKIEAGSKESPVVLSKEEVPADGEAIEKVVATLLSLKKTGVVTSNPAKHPLFEIGQYSLSVSLYGANGRKLGKIFIGKEGPDMFSSYVLKEGETEVHLVPEFLSGMLNKTLEDWKEKDASSSQSSS